MSNVFAEDEYYVLLLIDELKEHYCNEQIVTCFDLFSRLKHENKRIWVNIRGSKGQLDNSYFVSGEKLTAEWNLFIVTDYFQRGFYDKYYIVNCMHAINYQHWRIRCEQIAEASAKEREEKRKIEEQKALFGKQYNIFGGVD